MTEHPAPEHSAQSMTEQPPAGPAQWRRLDSRMLAIAPVQEVVRFIPLLVAALLAGGSGNRQWWLLGTLGAVAGYGVLRWITTRYRLTGERIELRTGLLFRQHRSVPRDRVRTVDLTAKPLHRLVRLNVLRVGTGQHEPGHDGELTLDAVGAGEAERLRALLLDRSTVAQPAGSSASPPLSPLPSLSIVDGTGIELARLHLSWLRFAPLTVLGVAAVGALYGGTWQLLSEAGVNVEDVGTVRQALRWLGEQSVSAVVAVVTAVLLVIGTLGALVLYVLAWWGYRLTREADGTLRVNRGLLTRRSVSLEERRLRGVELTEPLLLRAGRGARCAAVATGARGGDRSSLLPPAPRAAAHQVAAAVLGEADSPTLLPLRRHPPAALRRRLTRTVVPAAAVVAALGLADLLDWLPGWPWQLAAATLLPVAVLLGLDRYRNLGHTLTGQHLVVRNGSLVRSTVALRRSGIIGWQVSQSVFQRSAGLASATAITAAGAGSYTVLDVDMESAAHLVNSNLG